MNRLHWPSILIEAGLVVLGVFLALLANEWWSGVRAEREAESLLGTIREEVVYNREHVEASFRYHWLTAGQLREALGRGDRLSPADFEEGYISQHEPVSGAWTIALEADAVRNLPVSTSLALSEAYQRQERYADQRGLIGGLIYERMFTEGLDALPSRPASHLALLGSMMYLECRLLESFEEAVREMDGAAFDGEAWPVVAECAYLLG